MTSRFWWLSCTLLQMRTLYHLLLSPYCRKVRIVLAEKSAAFDLREENVWEQNDSFVALNPACEVPVLIDGDFVIADSAAICEYLDETLPDRSIFGFDPPSRAETRRLVAWFDQKMGVDVTRGIIYEKVYRRIQGEGAPDSRVLHTSLRNLRHHLDYIGELVESRNWLAGDEISLADMAAAAHVSCLDYLGDIPWEDYGQVKDWYVRVKSRPSFRPLLGDYISGMPPPKHYADLDF